MAFWSRKRKVPEIDCAQMCRMEDHARNIPRELYPEIHYALNCWEWHPALGEAPEGWSELTWQEKRPIVESWMTIIECKCSKKELLRYHHIHNLGSTEQEFEDWWDSEIMRRLELITGSLA